MGMKLKVWEKMKAMSVRTKRILALSVCLVLLGIAIFQNVRTGKNTAAKPVDQQPEVQEEIPVGVSKIEDSEEYFAQRRLERMNDRSTISAEYAAIAADSEAGEDAVSEAIYMIEALNTISDCERDVEARIKALGYSDVFATLALSGEVDITVLAESLSEADVNSIAAVAAELTQASMDAITVRGVRGA